MYNVCMIRINLYITKTQQDALKYLNEQDGLSISEHIRRAIDRYIPAGKYGPDNTVVIDLSKIKTEGAKQ